MSRLFVGGLPYSINDEALGQMFAPFGQVTSANVITDKYSGRSKGFGFVEMDDAAAQEAITKLNGSQLEERTISVSVARPREERPQFSPGGYNRDRNPRGGHRNNRQRE
jgi:RNA recognition motif-containing protein